MWKFLWECPPGTTGLGEKSVESALIFTEKSQHESAFDKILFGEEKSSCLAGLFIDLFPTVKVTSTLRPRGTRDTTQSREIKHSELTIPFELSSQISQRIQIVGEVQRVGYGSSVNKAHMS